MIIKNLFDFKSFYCEAFAMKLEKNLKKLVFLFKFQKNIKLWCAWINFFLLNNPKTRFYQICSKRSTIWGNFWQNAQHFFFHLILIWNFQQLLPVLWQNILKVRNVCTFWNFSLELKLLNWKWISWDPVALPLSFKSSIEHYGRLGRDFESTNE